MEQKRISELFGIASGDASIAVRPACEHTPAQQHYAFSTELVRTLLLWLFGPMGTNLYLTGPTGAGKSSVIEQFIARVGGGLLRVGCHSRMEVADLVGRFVLTSTGGMEFAHGPLVQAMRDGHVLLLDEADLLPPPVAMGLNAVLDGACLYIPETKERVCPAANFRIAVTGNSAGGGDDTGLYRGVVRQNMAWMDRFTVIKVDYLQPEAEQQVLAAAVPALPKSLAAQMIEVANAVRAQYLAAVDNGEGLDITMSTRTLVRWGQLADAWRLAKLPNPLRLALKQALLNRASSATAVAIDEIAFRILGALYNDSSAD